VDSNGNNYFYYWVDWCFGVECFCLDGRKFLLNFRKPTNFKTLLSKFDEMTYYHTQVLKITNQHLPKSHIIGHVIKAKNFIDENCCEDIDLETISDFSFLSKFHFIRLFKRCYGRTPHQYLTEKRIQMAKQLLQSNYSVTETCYQVGFDSTTSFAAVFKKYTGSSPSTFQKKQFSIGQSQMCIANLQHTKTS
jgi:AraC-like DNA-binding protein